MATALEPKSVPFGGHRTTRPTGSRSSGLGTIPAWRGLDDIFEEPSRP
jgi:hypothetical protein